MNQFESEFYCEIIFSPQIDKMLIVGYAELLD